MKFSFFGSLSLRRTYKYMWSLQVFGKIFQNMQCCFYCLLESVTVFWDQNEGNAWDLNKTSVRCCFLPEYQGLVKKEKLHFF